MLDFILTMIAITAGAATAPPSSGAGVTGHSSAEQTAGVQSPVVAGTVLTGSNVNTGSGVLIDGAAPAPADTLSSATAPPDGAAAPEQQIPAFNMSVVPAGLVAEPQVATGKFTTALEIKPIMQATRGNWVAVREYNGQDLLYVTHIWGWRCGLAAMAISVNGERMQNWPLPACHTKYATPNAVLETDGLPYLKFTLGSLQTVDIQLVYDDLSMDTARFERGNVLIP